MRASMSSTSVCDRLIRRRSTRLSVSRRITSGSYDEGPSVQMICTWPAPSFIDVNVAPSAPCPSTPQ